MKAYATLAVARMQAGIIAKKTGVKPMLMEHEGQFWIGSEEELVALSAPKKAPKKAKVVAPTEPVKLSGVVVRDTGKFICLDLVTSVEWFNYKQLDALWYDLGATPRTATLETMFPAGFKDLRGRPRA